MNSYPSSRRLCRELFAVIVASLVTLAPVHAQVRDYSKGFQEFYKLGFPDAAKAEYVNINVYREYGPDMNMMMGALYELKLAGNGWMLEETPKVKGRFIVGNCRVLEVYDQEALMKERQKKWAEAQKTNTTGQVVMVDPWRDNDGKTLGQWKKVDAKKDIEKILAYLKKRGEKNERFDSMDYSGGYGALFLNAIHFHRRGYTNEANAIVGQLFEAAGDPRKVLVQGMSHLADSRYSGAYDAFLKDGNWETFGKELDTLLAKFATSWKTAPAAKRLADRVNQQLAQPQVPPLVGEGLTDEDKALALELATARLPTPSPYNHYGGSGQLWILPAVAPAFRYPGMPDGKGDTNVVSRIKKRGMKSIPLLLALLKDDTLTRMDMQSVRGNSGYSRSYFSSDGDQLGEEQINQMYESMRRPASRSDIAFFLLQSVLPQKEEQMQRRQEPMGRDELAEECKTWCEANKNKTPLELARLYGQEGNQEQQRAGMQYLVKKGTDADMEAIEKRFLESSNPAMNAGVVQEYVQARGEKAKAFLEKYEARVNEKASAGSDEMFNDKQFKKMAKQQLKYLKNMVTFKPPKELLAEVAAGTKTINEISQGFYQGIAKEKTDDVLTMVLDAALNAKDAATCRDLLYMAAAAGRARGGMEEEVATDGEDGEAAQAPSEPPKLQIAKHADAWKKLLADTRSLSDGIGGGPVTVGDAAATMINTVYGQDERVPYAMRPRTYTALGKRTSGIYRARAEALLAGKKGAELPQFPSLTDITDEQKKAVVEKIMKTAEASLAQTVSALSPNELVALSVSVPKDAKLKAKLVPVANKVQAVSGDVELAADVKELESAKGKAMNKETVDRLLALCRKLTAAGKVVSCTANRLSGLDGIEITVRQTRPQSKEYAALVESGVLGGAEPTADISGTVADSACHGAAVWPMDTPATAEAAKKPAAGEDEKLLDAAVVEAEAQIKADGVKSQSEFWKAVEQFCAGKGNVCGSGMISFFGKPAVKTPPPVGKPKATAESKPVQATTTPAAKAQPAAPVQAPKPAAPTPPAKAPAAGKSN